MESAFSSPSTQTAFVGTTLTISGIKLKLGHVFAEGGYSFIHNAKPVSPASATTRYAVKRISCADPDTEKQTHREIEFLRQLPSHPNIVRFYDAVFQDNHAFLLFELVDGGTLAERLNSSSLDARSRLSIFADAVAAVTHLHAQNPPVAIRDVKLENLLYDRLEGRYKLCDFGSVTTTACRLSSRKEILAAEEDVANTCTAMYRAPELVDLYSKQFICERVDVWALGCVWHAILFGTLPFDGQSSLQISKGLQIIPTNPTYPDEFTSLLKGMLTVDPADRLDAFAIFEAVTEIIGKEFDPSLRAIGLNLRQRREADFGRSAKQLPIADSSNLFMKQTELQPENPSILTASTSGTNHIDLFDESSPVQFSAPSRTTMQPYSQQEPESWADFDSAFGGAVSKSTKVGDSRTDVGGGNPRALPQYNDNDSRESTSGRGHLAPLLDFSDLHISPQTEGQNCKSARATTGPVQRSLQPSQQSKHGPGSSASDFADLIDFG